MPLSFVTSFFGMNTANIRTQWVFWATSIPLTLVIVFLALLVGFEGDYLREAWETLLSRRHKTKNPVFNIPAVPREEEDEKFPVITSEKPMPVFHNVLRKWYQWRGNFHFRKDVSKTNFTV